MAEKKSKFSMEKKSAWETFKKEQEKIFDFCDVFKKFLNKSKTERETIQNINAIAKDRNVINNKQKEAAIVINGEKSVEEGLRIIISHVDCPRLDLKQIPLFEDSDSNLALFETHYYGGIKKFQWLTIPLSLHGVIFLKNGEKLSISLGENKEEPVFSVPDLLPHLSRDVQYKKKLGKAIEGENLDIVVGGIPANGEEKDKIKNAILEKLNKEYGIIEEDFVSAELEAVPAYNPRDVGFDKSMIGGYGQDDGACVYSSLKAILDIEKPKHTAISLFVDKEEIGSEGNTSARVTTFLRSIIKKLNPEADIEKIMLNSKVISADVNAAVTPNYTQVFELKNASSLGNGVVMSKYTGHGGKYAANDASAEYVSEIRAMLNKNNIPWQTGELGKVDKGGGGTVAKYFSRLGMEVIDLGPPVLSMHAPFEITSKADIYSSYQAYKTFLKT